MEGKAGRVVGWRAVASWGLGRPGWGGPPMRDPMTEPRGASASQPHKGVVTAAPGQLGGSGDPVPGVCEEAVINHYYGQASFGEIQGAATPRTAWGEQRRRLTGGWPVWGCQGPRAGRTQVLFAWLEAILSPTASRG